MSIKHALSALLLASSAAHAQVGERVVLPSFAIDRTEVTIAQFERYVQATGTVTRAEKDGGGFEYGAGWERRPGWSWRKPDGQTSRADMPAVHLDFAEAQAYCRWAGGRLPTGDEWAKGRLYRAARYTACTVDQRPHLPVDHRRHPARR